MFHLAIFMAYKTRCETTTSWWRYQMETFSALLAICAGNSPVTDEFPAKRPVTRSFDVFLICARIHGWVNNREAGDLRRHRAHYDVTVIIRSATHPSPFTHPIPGYFSDPTSLVTCSRSRKVTGDCRGFMNSVAMKVSHLDMTQLIAFKDNLVGLLQHFDTYLSILMASQYLGTPKSSW